jgi:hypothetical protein
MVKLIISEILISCQPMVKLIISEILISCQSMVKLIISEILISCQPMVKLIISEIPISCQSMVKLIISEILISCRPMVKLTRGRRGPDHMVVGFTATCEISAHHQWSWEFEPCWWRGLLDTTLCDKLCQWLATGLWFSEGTPVSSTNKTDCHDITEILLKVVLNTKTLTL